MRLVAATITGISAAAAVTAVAVCAAASAVAECREHEEYDDPYPDVSVFKNIAKAVHLSFLLIIGIPFGVLCYYLMAEG